MTARRDARTPTSATAADPVKPRTSVHLWMAGLLFAFSLTTVASVLPYLLVLHTIVSSTIFWPPEGILTVLLLITRGRDRWLSVAIALVANILIELYVYSPSRAIVASSGNVTECLLVAVMTQRICGPKIDFSRLDTLWRFALLCVIPVALITVTSFTVLLALTQPYPVWPFWRGTVVGEALGIIMVAPALHILTVPSDRGLFERSALERTMLFGTLLGTEFALFGLSSTPALFIMFPILVGISFRLGPRAAAMAIIITALAVFGFTVYGTGPFTTFHQADLFGVGALLQIFILSVIYTVLPAAGAIAERLRAQQELRRVHRELVDTSRLAGRAEIATNVLHNVGNVLHSVSVSLNVLTEGTKTAGQTGLSRLASLLDQQSLSEFVASERGQLLPAFLAQLSKKLGDEQSAMANELNNLRRNVEHITEIIMMQQTHAKRIGVREELDLAMLVEEGLRLGGDDCAKHGIELTREFASLPSVVSDRHKLLEILVNLVSNAMHACEASLEANKRIRVRITCGSGMVTLSVADNGVGIAPENMPRLFTHGFTTRPSGHGFGLHSSSLAATELGGRLSAHSPGPGLGATFTLEFPLSTVEARHAA